MSTERIIENNAIFILCMAIPLKRNSSLEINKLSAYYNAQKILCTIRSKNSAIP